MKERWPTTEAPARDGSGSLLKERPSSCEQRGGDQRKPPERRSYWPGRSNYSGQPVGGQKNLGYQYDLGGNIIGIRDKAPASLAVKGPGDLLKEFEYDPLKRLLNATGRESTQPAIVPSWDQNVRGHDHTATNTYTRAYEYDKVGNVLKEQHTANSNPSNSFTKTFQYHATQEHNKLLSFTVGGNTYTHAYDACGNLITENTTRKHQWGFNDSLRYFMIQSSGVSSPTVWAHYLYDAGGQRVKKVVNKPHGIQEVTMYIDGVYEHSYVKTSGTIDTNKHYNTLHVMDGRSRIATLRVGNDTGDSTPAVKYNAEDHLGTSTVVQTTTGTLVNREEYYPFGETCFGAFAKKRYRYNGKEKDNESGLYNYGMRYYAPWMCRFVSVDPLAAEYPHYTPYQYAGNKPINFVDLDGLEEGDPSTGNLKVNIYVQRDAADGTANTAAEGDAVDNWFTNWTASINNVWNNGALTINGLTVNTSEVTFSEAGPNFTQAMLGENDILLTVGTGGSIQASHPDKVATQTSFVNEENSLDPAFGNGYMFLSDASSGAHEFGHLFGLSDRYHEAVSYSSPGDQLSGTPRSTVPMILPDPNIDPQYNPLDNLYSTGSPTLTDMQLGVVFRTAPEARYPTVVVVNSRKITYQMIQVQDAPGGPTVTSYTRNARGVDIVQSTNVNWAKPSGPGFQYNGQIVERALFPGRGLSRNPGPNRQLIRQRYLGQ